MVSPNRRASQRPATAEARAALGLEARKSAPRSSLSQWSPMPDRQNVVEQLAGQEVERVPNLLPLRHSRMSVNPFTFYRGSALTMAADLGSRPNSGLQVQLCGDAHLSNFGLFAAPDRAVIFDINDFDETLPGPFEFDVARLTTSFTLAGQNNGFSSIEIENVTRAAAASYRNSMAGFAQMGELDIWYTRTDSSVLQSWGRDAAGKKGAQVADRTVAKAQKRTSWSAINKMTELVDGQRRFINSPPLLVRIEVGADVHPLLTGLLEQYRETLIDDRRELFGRYKLVDIGHKVVGVGSVGLLAFVILLQGRDESDLLVLQVKQAVRSVLEPFTNPSSFEQQGERVVSGQRVTQAASDIFLGWIRGAQGRDFYIRQLRDMKWSPDVTLLNPDTLQAYAMICGNTLARAHARSGDAVAISSYLGTSAKFDNAMLDFALAYAGQVGTDFATYTQAIASGKVTLAADEVAAATLAFTAHAGHGIQATRTPI